MPEEKWFAPRYRIIAVAWVEFYETRGGNSTEDNCAVKYKKARLGRAYIELALGLLANY